MAKLTREQIEANILLQGPDKLHLDLQDLRGLNLSGLTLDGASLKAINGDGLDLSRSSLIGADFSLVYEQYKEGPTPARMNLSNFEDADLQHANLARAMLKAANLERANMKKVHLEWANLEGANLRGANLQGATLNAANLQNANLEGVDLRGADLAGATYSSTTIWPTGFSPEAAGMKEKENGDGCLPLLLLVITCALSIIISILTISKKVLSRYLSF